MTPDSADPAFLILVWGWVSAVGLGTTVWMLVRAFGYPDPGSNP